MHNMLYLIGRLVDNPVIEDNSEDKKISNIVIAVQRAWKNEKGIYETDFFECTLINGIAENVVNYCKKGDLVGIKGRLESKKYDGPDTNIKQLYRVIVEKISFLSSKAGGDE